jgi:hypothetical protein
MTNQSDSLALSPLMFGEAFFAGAAAMQRQIAEGMMAVFDAVADAMSDSLRATAALAHDIGNAEKPSDVAAAGIAWFQGRVERATTWWRALFERVPFPSSTPTAAAPEPKALPAPAAVKRAPVLPQPEPSIASKPPAGKLRRAAPVVVDKAPKKTARPAAK